MSRENRGKRYLFVCVHNSGRSQMAEAFTRHLSNGTVSAESAGTEPSQGVNPVVVEAMSEIGIDLDATIPRSSPRKWSTGPTPYSPWGAR